VWACEHSSISPLLKLKCDGKAWNDLQRGKEGSVGESEA
jgi:hypothetical protein